VPEFTRHHSAEDPGRKTEMSVLPSASKSNGTRELMLVGVAPPAHTPEVSEKVPPVDVVPANGCPIVEMIVNVPPELLPPPAATTDLVIAKLPPD